MSTHNFDLIPTANIFATGIETAEKLYKKNVFPNSKIDVIAAKLKQLGIIKHTNDSNILNRYVLMGTSPTNKEYYDDYTDFNVFYDFRELVYKEFNHTYKYFIGRTSIVVDMTKYVADSGIGEDIIRDEMKLAVAVLKSMGYTVSYGGDGDWIYTIKWL